ncbi:hypothetical protein EMIT0111MI5_30188 [Burkholderia sp. IT-111MI5]
MRGGVDIDLTGGSLVGLLEARGASGNSMFDGIVRLLPRIIILIYAGMQTISACYLENQSNVSGNWAGAHVRKGASYLPSSIEKYATSTCFVAISILLERLMSRSTHVRFQ